MGNTDFRRKLGWVGAVFGLYVLVWYSHVALSAHEDPLGVRVDFALWVASSVLKLAALFATWWLLSRVHGVVYRSRACARSAFAIWAIATLTFITLLALSRSVWAPLLNGSSVKYYYSGDALRLPPDIARHRAAWSAAWSHGFVLAAESLLMLVLSTIQATVALFFGRKRVVSALGACALCAGVIGAYVALCPWFLADYDFFHGELIAGALILDLVAVPANDPYTSLTLPFYAVLAIANVVILRRWSAA